MDKNAKPHQANLRKGRYSQAFGIYFVTKTLRLGSPHFTPDQMALITAAFQTFRGKNYFYLHAFVVMPDHWHALFSLGSEKTLSQTVHAFNRWITYGNKSHSIAWEDGFYDRKVRENDSVTNIVSYIENNPVRKELADEPENWPWSSAHPSQSKNLDRDFLGHERWR